MNCTSEARWGLGDAVAGFVIAQVVSNAVLAAWLTITGEDQLSLLALAIGQLGLWAGLWGAPLWAARSRGSGDLAVDFGLRGSLRDGTWLAIGVLCQVIAIPLLYFVIELITGSLDVGAPARELTERFDGLGYVVLAVLVVVFAPIVEEVFYRGLVLRAAARRWGSRTAIVVSSIWFGASHFQLVQFPALFGFGVVLAALAIRTGRLGPPIAAHAGFNLVTVIAIAASR